MIGEPDYGTPRSAVAEQVTVEVDGTKCACTTSSLKSLGFML